MSRPTDGAESQPDRTAEQIPEIDQDMGGDPVCWLDKVCPSCGLFTGDRPSATCPRCGEDLATS
jgi:rubrerythrin